MKEPGFLKKLEKKKIIGLVEPSEEMKSSYLIKAENCLKSAKILFKNSLYENSISEAYYCMYNSLLALLFKIGIKSENHSASIVLFDKLIGDKKLSKAISWAKEERKNKQYFVETRQIAKATQESCSEMISVSEDFLVEMKVIISEIRGEKVISIRRDFTKLLS